jgi:hypothetical protein
MKVIPALIAFAALAAAVSQEPEPTTIMNSLVTLLECMD